jgi:hypothetical protein
MTRTIAALAALALLAGPTVAAAARFAVVAGNDRGDVSRPRLWFAEKDAERVHRALVELGDFDKDGTVLLRGKNPSALADAIRALETQIRAARDRGERTMLLVFYSGHAAAGGLEMGNEKFAFSSLRDLVSASVADAKVAIVDACEAGLLTQVKGAAPVPALAFPLPMDDVQGTAFVASTAVGEAAQESAALGGSFFTHHLEIAIRGAGDADGDGRVTLSEAFRYTSSRTSAGTAGTEVGAQHPTYDFKMSGRGDVVLSDLRRAVARLLVPPDVGAMYFLKGPGGIFAEVQGSTSELTLALPVGDYRIERRGRDGRATGEVTLDSGRTSTLPRLIPTRYEMARAKGGPKPGLLYSGVGASWFGLPGFGVAPTARIGLRKEFGPVGFRLRLDYANAQGVKDEWLEYDFGYMGGALAALYPLNVGRVLIEGGLEVGYGYGTQTLRDRRSFSSGIGSLGAAFLVTAPFGPLRAGLDVSAGTQFLTLDREKTVRPGASAALLILYGF